jgi:hypothetical protein
MSYFAQVYAAARRFNKGIEIDASSVSSCATCLKRTDKVYQSLLWGLNQVSRLFIALLVIVSGIVALPASTMLGKIMVKLAGEYIIDKPIRPKVHKLRCASSWFSFNLVLTTQFLWQGFMTELPEIQTILKQFPWTRIEKGSGSFNFELALAMRGLLGSGPNFMWWILEEPDFSLTLETIITSGLHLPASEWGAILLSDTHLDKESGWKLPANEMPWPTFSRQLL